MYGLLLKQQFGLSLPRRGALQREIYGIEMVGYFDNLLFLIYKVLMSNPLHAVVQPKQPKQPHNPREPTSIPLAVVVKTPRTGAKSARSMLKVTSQLDHKGSLKIPARIQGREIWSIKCVSKHNIEHFWRSLCCEHKVYCLKGAHSSMFQAINAPFWLRSAFFGS